MHEEDTQEMWSAMQLFHLSFCQFWHTRPFFKQMQMIATKIKFS